MAKPLQVTSNSGIHLKGTKRKKIGLRKVKEAFDTETPE